MAETLTGGQRPFASVQSAAAGVNLNGALPAATVALSERVLTWSEDATNAGLFPADVWANYFRTVVIDQIQIALVAGSGYSVSVVRADGTVHLLTSASGLSAVGVFIQGPIYLTRGEGLKIVTTGATGANKPYAKIIHRFWEPVGTY